jgi:hypothetical protein
MQLTEFLRPDECPYLNAGPDVAHSFAWWCQAARLARLP